MLPITSYSPQLSHFHTGKGVPQYRCLVTELSLRLSSQESNCLFPAQSGFQEISLLSSRMFSLRSSMRKNHCVVVRKTTGLLQRQQCAYSCCTGVFATNTPLSDNDSTNFRSSFFALSSANTPISLGNTPCSSMILKAGNPSR